MVESDILRGVYKPGLVLDARETPRNQGVAGVFELEAGNSTARSPPCLCLLWRPLSDLRLCYKGGCVSL